MFRPNLILRIVVGLCVGGSIVGGTALAGSRVIPVAGGGELQGQVKATATKVIPAVVSIASTMMVRDQAFSDEALPFGLFKDAPPRRQYGQGSGVIVSSDGYILTNNHVIADAVDVDVILADRRQYKGRVVATDPKTDEQIKQFQDKRHTSILHFPTVLGAVVPIYNIPGVLEELNFTPEALAGIFLGKIKKWNDPEIAKANPNSKLPGNDIVVVHRAEASGTSYIWVDYLSKVNPEWKSKVGTAAQVNWPVGLGGKGNEGVAGQVQQTPNALGYVELIYAVQNKMHYGRVKNAAGVFVKAELSSVTAAAAGAAADMPDDFRVSITNAPGKAAYPISSFTWLLIPVKIDDATKKKALTDFLHWMLTDGQKMTEALTYAQLPKPVVAKEIKAISKIQ